MKKIEAKKRIKKLRQVINHQRYLYHVLDKEGISDEAHDSLKHELWELEQQFPDLVTPDSPTQRVGGEPLDKFEKVEHTQPMLSIEDIFTAEEFASWEDRILRLLSSPEDRKLKSIEYFSELKIDGFAVTLIYRKGIFEAAATRGNGQVGENVTQNVKTIESIPLRLEIARKLPENIQKKLEQAIRQGEIEVRGEVYMKKKAFEKFNTQRVMSGEEPYANPRNLAAGSIRQLDPKLAASRPLEFLAYGLVGNFGQETHSQEHAILQAIGFKTDTTAKICQSADEVLEYWNAAAKKRAFLPFQIDGAVAQINNNRAFGELGVAGKGYRGMRALKFAGKQATTKVLDIQTQIGRTGAVTPVALLQPVQVAGVSISRATLHNEDELKRLGVKIGDTVIIERAGDVIPAVVQVLEDLRDGTEKSFYMPRVCPICGSVLEKPAGEAVTRCAGKNCRAMVRQYIKHFVSKKAFDIEGLGPKIIEQLMEQGLIQNAADLFELTEGDVIPLERFADKSARNLLDAIEQSKKIPFEKFLYALGIRHVGEETARALARNFQFSIFNFQTLSLTELEHVPGIGPRAAESIYDWFQTKENIEFIKRLEKLGVQIQYAGKKIHNTALREKVFVLTGSLGSLSREEAKEKVRQAGGSTAESVSKNTNYVVAGKNPGSKLEQAKKLGIKTLTEQEFLKMVNL